MAHEVKGWPITTWRRPIGEKVRRSVWHMKIKAGPLLHGGGLIGEKCVAHEDKGRPITTWRRPIGEKVRRSVWHMKTKAGPLLHGGGI